MTSDFLHRHKAGLLLFFYALFSLICVTNRIDPYVQGIKASVWYLIKPEVVYTGTFFNKLDFLRGRLFHLFKVEGENYILRDQLSELAIRELERDALSEENRRLRALLDLREKSFPDAVAAAVVGHDLRDWFYAVILDKGRRSGIEPSAAVIGGAPERPALVGRIVEADPSTSKVLLITDPVSAVSVVVRPSGDLGLLEGRSEPTLVIRYLSNRATLKIGDEVTTVGLGGVFPPGVPVGRVLRVYSTPDRFFKEAIVQPYAEIGSLREVLVLQRETAPRLEVRS